MRRDKPGASKPRKSGLPEGLAPLAVNQSQCGKLLGISRSRVIELTRSGDLPAVRVGSRLLYSIRALDAWLARKEQEGDPNATQ